VCVLCTVYNTYWKLTFSENSFCKQYKFFSELYYICSYLRLLSIKKRHILVTINATFKLWIIFVLTMNISVSLLNISIYVNCMIHWRRNTFLRKRFDSTTYTCFVCIHVTFVTIVCASLMNDIFAYTSKIVTWFLCKQWSY
jgi:hypothetical protein